MDEILGRPTKDGEGGEEEKKDNTDVTMTDAASDEDQAALQVMYTYIHTYIPTYPPPSRYHHCIIHPSTTLSLSIYRYHTYLSIHTHTGGFSHVDGFSGCSSSGAMWSGLTS